MYVQGRHAFAMFHAHTLREGRGHAYTNVTTITRLAKKLHYGQLLALLCYFVYFQATLLFSRHFFFLHSVWRLLEKKNTKDNDATTNSL